MAALAYRPMSSPALTLSVAKRASVASCGSVGLSSAMTRTPLARAFSRVGTIALESLGVMRMPFTPELTMFSMAVTWPALSPSNFPAALTSSTSLSFAACSAPSFIFTKNGFVSVLVISPTLVPPPPDPPCAPEPQAVRVSAETAARAVNPREARAMRFLRSMTDLLLDEGGTAARIECCGA